VTDVAKIARRRPTRSPGPARAAARVARRALIRACVRVRTQGGTGVRVIERPRQRASAPSQLNPAYAHAGDWIAGDHARGVRVRKRTGGRA